jgi:hypothetical protein
MTMGMSKLLTLILAVACSIGTTKTLVSGFVASLPATCRRQSSSSSSSSDCGFLLLAALKDVGVTTTTPTPFDEKYYVPTEQDVKSDSQRIDRITLTRFLANTVKENPDVSTVSSCWIIVIRVGCANLSLSLSTVYAFFDAGLCQEAPLRVMHTYLTRTCSLYSTPHYDHYCFCFSSPTWKTLPWPFKCRAKPFPIWFIEPR